MPNEVTDPDLLAKLNASGGKEVTDTSLLDKLNAIGDEHHPEKSEGFWDYEKRNSLLGNAITGAQQSGISALQFANFIGRNLYGELPSDKSERAAYEAAQKKLEKQEGSGAANFVARQAGDPLNYPLFEMGGEKGIELIGKAAKKTGENAQLLKEGFKARTPEMLANASENIAKEGHQSFTAMRQSGVSLKPDVASALTKHIQQEVGKMGVLNPKIHGDTISIMKQMQAESQKGMSIDRLHQFRKLFRGAEKKELRAGNDEGALAAQNAIHAMDEAIETIKIKGGSAEGSKAIESMQQGIKTWAKLRKFDTISDAIERSQGDPDKLKTALKKIYDTPKLHRGFTSEEMAALKEAKENSTTESLMKLVGKFGFDISKGVQGNKAPLWTGAAARLLGAPSPDILAATAAGTAARYGQKLAARGKAERLLKSIEGNPPINTGTPLGNVVRQLHPPQ